MTEELNFETIIFQNFFKIGKIHHYSKIADKGLSIAERALRTIRNFSKKPVFLKGKAAWASQLPSVIKQN